MQRAWLIAAIGAALACVWASAARATVLFPAVDYSARTNGGTSGGPSLDYRLDRAARIDNRPGMEFSLAGLPTDQVLLDATLRMMPTAKTGPSSLEIHGYVGNGSFAISDPYGDRNLIGRMTNHVVGVQESIELDPGYITSLLGMASHIGIGLREITDGALGSFASRTTATPPELELTFLSSTAPNSNHWTTSGIGSWNTSSNWSLGTPLPSDDIFIQPSAPSTVLGPPTFEDVSTLTLGGGAGQATFVVPENQQFMSRGLTTLYGNGVLDLNGGTYRTGGLHILPGGAIDWGDDSALAIESGYLSMPVGDFIIDGPATPLLLMVGGKFIKYRTPPAGQPDGIIIGDAQGAYLLVANDSEVRARIVRLGTQATGNGTLQIEDEGALMRVDGLLEVGPSGTGRVSVEQGARLEGGLVIVGSTLQGATNFNTPDTMIFTDAGTTASLSSLDSNGRSLVEIRNGAVVQAGGAGGSGDPASPPVLRVSGAGSQLILRDRLQTGSTFMANGASQVFVEDGGRIDTNLVVLGVASSTNGTSHAELTITGEGSQLVATSNVILGGLRTTEAIVNVLDGGVLRAGDQTLLTASVNDVASVLVAGGGRWEQTGEISVGGGRDLDGNLADIGVATLTLQTGGMLEATTAVNVMARGTLNLDGGTLTAPLVRHNRGGIFNFTGGTLSTGTFQGDLVNQGGVLLPGGPPGITTIEGNYTQLADAHLQLEIGGRTPGTQHDQVNVAGQATLDGTLNIVRINGFTPTMGDRFQVMTFGSREGTFANVTGTTINPFLRLAPVYSATDLALVAFDPATKTWGVDARGQASVGANWFGGVPPTAPNDIAMFTSVITANRTAEVDVPLSLSHILFDDDNNYTIAGPQAITIASPFNDPVTIRVRIVHGHGAHTISAPLVLDHDVVILQESIQPLTIAGPIDNSAGHRIEKFNAGTAVFSGSQTLGSGTRIEVGSGKTQYSLDAADAVSIGTNVVAQISAPATLELAGTRSALSDGVDHANITGAGTLLVTGTSQAVGNITGTGETIVGPAADLTAGVIQQSRLSLLNVGPVVGGKVTLRPNSGTSVLKELVFGIGALPEQPAAIPEPSTFALTIIVLLIVPIPFLRRHNHAAATDKL